MRRPCRAGHQPSFRRVNIDMIKKLSIVLITFVLPFLMSACGSSGQPSENPENTTGGGWSLYENEAAALPENVQAAFDKASETYTESELKPVAYIASQVVAGTNYMILCEAAATEENPTISYQMVVVYADLGGMAEISQVNEFDLTAYTEGDTFETNTQQLSGGWQIAEEGTSVSIPKEVKGVFDQAMESVDWAELEPMALLGSQVVAGTNYAFLCYSTQQTDEAAHGIQVVTVYADMDGNADVKSIAPVEPADYNMLKADHHNSPKAGDFGAILVKYSNNILSVKCVRNLNANTGTAKMTRPGKSQWTVLP